MATPLTVAIPPLKDGQYIATWQPLFMAAVASMDQKEAVKLLPAYVKRGRLVEKVVLGAVLKDTLEEAFAYLKERLDPEEDIFDSAARFRTMTWVPGEPVQDFFVRYLEEAVKVGIKAKTACILMVSQVPTEIRAKLKDWIKTKDDGLAVDDALRFCTILRNSLLEKGIPSDRGCRVQLVGEKSLVDAVSDSTDSNDSESIEAHKPSIQNVRTKRFNEAGKYKSFSHVTDKSKQSKCYSCGSTKHFIRSCPNRHCYVCGELSHKPFNCPRKTGDQKGKPKNSLFQVSTGEDTVTVKVEVGAHKLAAVLDTGAKPSVMDYNTATQLELIGDMVPAPSKVYGLCDNPVRVLGYIDGPIRIGHLDPVIERFYILDSEEPLVLLGRHFMELHGSITFDWSNRRIHIGKAWIPVENSLSGATPLMRAMVARHEDEMENEMQELNEAIISKDLSTERTSELEELLRKYHKRPKRCKLNEFHSIITGEAHPRRSRPRRVPPNWATEISRQLEEMLAADPPICRPSKSPWSSDVVLVNKKDGTLRFAIDYRRLNSVTKRDYYSLPDPQAIFDKLNGNNYFSKLDIASAYWTIPILPRDVEKTAFHTPRGMYEMLVMPFGLCNAPATFQRIMDRALDKTPNCESYVDDILVFSSTFEEHLDHLHNVFQRLEAAGLQLRRGKCKVGYTSMEFLGHRISNTGRSPVPDYIRKLENFPYPVTVAELQRFLGTVNYYRCYLKDLSKIAEPLYALLKKGKAWQWNEACREAFDQLRTQLVKEHVSLSHPNWQGEFYIEADASTKGIGAKLSQWDEDSGKLRPVQFFSSTLNPTQKNYSAGQLEAWALVAACRKWSVYLKGASSIVLLTDHCPLKWLQSQKDPKHTFARWLMELQKLPFRISYRPGSENQAADYLSRNSRNEFDREVNEEEIFEEKVFQIGSKDTADLYQEIQEQQGQDPVITNALSQLVEHEKVTTGQLKRVTKNLRIEEGILKFMDRIVVPKHLREDVILRTHSQHHFGNAGTLHSLRKNFFWLRMPREVKFFCRFV